MSNKKDGFEVVTSTFIMNLNKHQISFIKEMTGIKNIDEAVEHFENYIASTPNNDILEKKAKKHIGNSKFITDE